MLAMSHQTTSQKKPFTIKRSGKTLKGIKSLAEAIIIQSIEDLYDPAYREESREFFGSSGFKTSAEIAGLNTVKQLKLLCLLGGRGNGRNAGRC